MSIRPAALALTAAGLAAVEAERAVINDLNVYPVPDGDTGTNLSLTIRAVLDELESGGDVHGGHGAGHRADTGAEDGGDHDDDRSAASDRAAVLAAITRGSLMGARGNSGVILSQIVRGACEALAAHGEFGPAAVRAALAQGSEAAYKAVRDPVEGTMLTVIREMAAAAQVAPAAVRLTDLLDLVAEAGRLAVEKTPEQLAVLHDAGVVDAGGYGLLVLFRGVAAELIGRPIAGEAVRVPDGDIRSKSDPGRGDGAMTLPTLAHGEHSELSRYRYCTSLLLSGERLSYGALEEFLMTIGDSVLVVGEASMLKLHVHVDDPGLVLSHAVTLGSISAIQIEDIHDQTRRRDERIAAPTAPRQDGGRTAVVAVVAGAGNITLFEQLGCAAIVDGGQSMNPSAAQLLAAIESTSSDEVLVLPNNDNIVLAAEQAAGLSSRHVAVVAAASMPAGLSAMVAFDPACGVAENVRVMDKAAAAVLSGEVTTAVRDSLVDGRQVRRGQTIGLVEGRLVAAGAELREVVTAVMAELAQREPEVVTLLASLDGSGVSLAEVERLAGHAFPGAEVDAHEGGQPHYALLIGAE